MKLHKIFKMKTQISVKGVALVLVLAVISVLSAVVVEFAYTTRVGMNLGATYRDYTIAESIARSGIEIAKKLLIKDLENDKAQGDMADFRISPEEMPSDDELWSQSESLAQMFNPFKNGSILLKIDDEGGKFNLNMITGMDGSRNENMVRLTKKLFENLEVKDSEEITNKIADWIDGDLEGEWEDGAKNAQIETLTELGLLNGIDYLEYIRIAGAAPDLPVFSTYLTVFPSRRYVEGAQAINWQININTAPPQVIMAIVKDADEEAANAIVKDIEKQHMGSPNAFTSYLSGLGLELEPGVSVSVRSDTFAVISEGIAGGGAGGVSCIIRAVFQRYDDGKVEVLYWRVD